VPFAFLWVPALAVKVFHYRNNAWPDTEENRAYQAKQRAKVEIAVTIAPAGMSIAILIYAAMRGFYG
jgi:heme/copper-type cytochrome/quinol oxidase subunit 2